MKKLLITGVSGMIGRYLIRELSDSFQTWGTYCHHRIQSKTIQSAQWFLDDPDEIRQSLLKMQPDIIVHGAAWTGVTQCEENPEQANIVNTDASRVIAESADKTGARMIYLSTDLVFDGKKGNYVETDLPTPGCHYGLSKYRGELEVLKNCRNAVVARLALVYGTAHPGGNSSSQWIVDALTAGKEIQLFTNEYRTPVWVFDVAKAIRELTEHDFTGILHLGSSTRVDRYTFGLGLARTFGLDESLIIPAESPANHIRPQDTSMNTNLARQILQTRLHDYQEGIVMMAGKKIEK